MGDVIQMWRRPPSRGVTIEEVDGDRWAVAINQWSTWLRASQRPATTVGLRLYQLNRFAKDHSGIGPWDITLDTLVTWLGAFTWSAETRRSYRSSLRGFYTWAHLTGRTTANPAFMLPPIKVPRGRPRPAPEEIVQDAMAHADGRQRLMLMLAAGAGLRRGEIAQVHTDDVHRDQEGSSLRVHGKGGVIRIVPLLDVIADGIALWPRGFLFPGKADGHLSPRRVGEIMSEILGGHWTAHTLRHRFAGKAYAAERDIRAVQELLGHASVVTTQIYTPVPSGALRSAVAAAA